MYKHVLTVSVAAVALSGCLHGRGEHTIPITRDYKNLEDVTIREAEPQVDKAHRVGAHHFAPYEATSAEQYLEFAIEARDEGDHKGARDYAGLAKKYAEEAIANGSGIEDKGEMPMPDNNEAARAEFDRLVARYKELCACKSKVVAPEIYAHLESNLAQAEHELNEHCDTPDAWLHLRLVEPDIDAIWAKDTDGDSVTDMHDGEPWIAEDKDGHQDEDGMPEPKPYPALEDIHFESGSAKLNAKAQGYLNGIAHMLYNGYKEATVILSGHTDSDASDTYNQELSLKREEAVKSYLIGAGVQQTMITSSHHGEAAPKTDNASEAAKAQNRRVEIKLDSPDPVSPFCQH